MMYNPVYSPTRYFFSIAFSLQDEILSQSLVSISCFRFRCISYKKVLPNGICIDELKEYRVAQTSIKAKSVNNRGKWVKALLSFVENKPFEKFQLYGKRMFQEYFTRTR